MRIVTILLLSATIAALPSCTKKSTPAPINLPGNATAYVVGVAGDTAVYFVNGKRYALTSGNTPASANAITLSGSDIYVAGYESNGKHLVAKLWKNGTAVLLSDTAMNAAANAISIVGSDIYVAGWISLGAVNAAALWKNGGLTLLTAAGHDGEANALFANGNDIYVAGYDSTAGQATACYWKNNAITLLPDSLAYAVATAITVSGSDIYLAGWDRTADQFTYMGPRLWKNGSILPLTTTTPYAMATSIIVANDTTYVAGEDYYRSVYWKNENENYISDGVQCNAITMDNGILYIAGQDGISGNGGNAAVFWRNGIAFPLDFSWSSPNAILVTN